MDRARTDQLGPRVLAHAGRGVDPHPGAHLSLFEIGGPNSMHRGTPWCSHSSYSALHIPAVDRLAEILAEVVIGVDVERRCAA